MRERERFYTLKSRLSWFMVNERSDCTDAVHICINRFDQIMMQKLLSACLFVYQKLLSKIKVIMVTMFAVNISCLCEPHWLRRYSVRLGMRQLKG